MNHLPDVLPAKDVYTALLNGLQLSAVKNQGTFYEIDFRVHLNYVNEAYRLVNSLMLDHSGRIISRGHPSTFGHQERTDFLIDGSTIIRYVRRTGRERLGATIVGGTLNREVMGALYEGLNRLEFDPYADMIQEDRVQEQEEAVQEDSRGVSANIAEVLRNTAMDPDTSMFRPVNDVFEVIHGPSSEEPTEPEVAPPLAPTAWQRIAEEQD